MQRRFCARFRITVLYLRTFKGSIRRGNVLNDIASAKIILIRQHLFPASNRKDVFSDFARSDQCTGHLTLKGCIIMSNSTVVILMGKEHREQSDLEVSATNLQM